MQKLTAIVGLEPTAGHGECFVWEDPSNGKVIAVDAGGAKIVGKAAGLKKPQVLILSHDDNDHIGGAVELISAAHASLTELWVPADWAFLLSQIARTPSATPAQTGNQPHPVSEEKLIEIIEDKLTETSELEEIIQPSAQLIARARKNLKSWNVGTGQSKKKATKSLATTPGETLWHGAKSKDEIINRVKSRAGHILKIFELAVVHNIYVKFFSVDLIFKLGFQQNLHDMLNQPAVIINAALAPGALEVEIPAGLEYSYALTKLTVQNRRSLCTFIPTANGRHEGGVMIWSDTDGGWISHAGPFVNCIIRTLSMSSAPHHASANPAHDAVWRNLNTADSSLLMINAGGSHNQRYRDEFKKLATDRRCCTWCRPESKAFITVEANDQHGVFKLSHQCRVSH